MRKLTSSMVCITLLCASCAGWQNSARVTVDRTQVASEKLMDLAMPALEYLCNKEIAKCEATSDPVCKGYKACKAIRRQLVNKFVLLQYACLDATAAIEIAEQGDALDALADVVRLLSELRAQFKELGII